MKSDHESITFGNTEWAELVEADRQQTARIAQLVTAATKVHGIIAEYWGPCMGSVECLLTLREAVGEEAKSWGPKVSDLPRVTSLETPEAMHARIVTETADAIAAQSETK